LQKTGGSSINATNANFIGCNLSHADFEGSNFCEANLSKVNLTWTSLRACNLSLTNLQLINFSYTDLSEASVVGADSLNAKCVYPWLPNGFRPVSAEETPAGKKQIL
jgi:uncharacterized protein YjbI with pentapeptide repeats